MAVAEADSTRLKPGKGAGLAAELSEIWQVESTRLAIWSPLLMAIGIWAYFSLRVEPQAGVAWFAFIASAIALLRFRHLRVLAMIALIVLGFAVSKLRTDHVATPLLRAFTPDATISGHVADVEHRNRGSIVLYLDVTDAGLPAAETPVRARLTWTGRKITPPEVGQLVTVRADLAPLPRPAIPGGFDYGRQLYFDSVGTTGRVKSLTVISTETPWRYQLRAKFHNLRRAIGERIRNHVPQPYDAIAEALITGERASIPRAMNDSLMASGLFHILSISGLHMTLVAGGAFWSVRAALALSPRLALQYPIKKWAAAVALAVGALYMMLADGGAATERAFLMIAVVFFAVIANRPAISLHNLAVAAMLILLWQPEQAVSASFQMSFLAVMGLAAFYPLWATHERRLKPTRSHRFVLRWLRRLVVLFAASLLTSIIAGSLSGLVAAHHFGRVAPFGVIANALATPVVGLIVMPMAMLAVLLMPLGLEGPPLWLMGRGLELMMAISDWVASWTLAGQRVPLMPAAAALTAALAAALLCLPATRLRWGAVPVSMLALALMQGPRPLLLIDDRAGNVALVTDVGLVPAVPRGAERTIAIWQDNFADLATFKDAAKRPGWSCQNGLCRARAGDLSIAYLDRSNETRRTCIAADVIVSAYPLRRMCKGRQLTIDRFDVWRSGAHAVYVDGTTLSVRTARGLQGERPWTVQPRARTNLLTGKSP